MENRQKDWLEWLASAKFAVNNKTHTATKVLLFMANYGRVLRIGECHKLYSAYISITSRPIFTN